MIIPTYCLPVRSSDANNKSKEVGFLTFIVYFEELVQYFMPGPELDTKNK